MLGLYVSDHPLFGAEDFLARRTDGTLDTLAECEDGAIKTFGGVITNLQRKWTKKGDLMGVFVLEDLQANAETMVFPRTMTEHGHKLADDAIVVVKARVDKRDDMPKLIAMEIDVVEGVADGAEPFRLAVMPNRLNPDLISSLKEILLEHPGDHPVLLHLGDDKVLRLPPAYGVDSGSGLVSEIRVLLGPERPRRMSVRPSSGTRRDLRAGSDSEWTVEAGDQLHGGFHTYVHRGRDEGLHRAERRRAVRVRGSVRREPVPSRDRRPDQGSRVVGPRHPGS